MLRTFLNATLLAAATAAFASSALAEDKMKVVTTFTVLADMASNVAGDAAEGVGPLATFRMGESVVLRLRNESPNNHPLHLHGLVFKPLRSNKRALAPHWTDTVLLEREETVDIAFVADNPGDWAFHCHVIEHQKTGLAGYIRADAA